MAGTTPSSLMPNGRKEVALAFLALLVVLGTLWLGWRWWQSRNPETWLHAASVARAAGQLDTAVLHYKNALQLDPGRLRRGGNWARCTSR